MKAKELAALLMKTPELEVVIRSSGHYEEAYGIRGTKKMDVIRCNNPEYSELFFDVAFGDDKSRVLEILILE